MAAESFEILERILRMKPVYDRLCEVASAKLLQAAEAGKYSLQYHKVAKGRGSRDWNADEETLTALFGDGIKTAPAPALLSVAQAEKKFGYKQIADYVNKIDGGFKIVPMSSILDEVSMNCSEFN